MNPSDNLSYPRQLPLHGIRVLDLSSVVLGPMCTQILADYGADVVKVESPEGDVMRHAGAKVEDGMGAMFLHVNEGKRSIVLDLKAERDLLTLHRLLPQFDVLIHNVRPEAAQRLGIDEAALRPLHPSLVYVVLTGYGESGPYAGRAAYDDIIQAQVGLADLFARQSGGAPVYVPALIADRVTGLTAAHATLAALYRRRETGEGECITVSMFETMAAFILGDHLGGASFEPSVGPMGYSRLLTPNRRPYRTRDGYVSVVVYNDKHWRSFFRVIDDTETFDSDRRFQTAAARAENYDAIYAFVADVLCQRTTAEWLDLLGRADIPCCAVNRVEDLLEDPHLKSVNFFETSESSTGTRMRRISARYRAPVSRQAKAAAAPFVGQHTAEVLAELERLDRQPTRTH